ncbi:MULTISPECIES: PfkB family carbohydrate kinase [unclassified Mycobacterium]|uniref:PfkB family carbohydrate kinase n=1 Tax=unclassified Mycobacterium TaxID=2642494 RepID=UPI0007FE8B4E|nr:MULTISPECIES: PfkB family carbohydrate kinase [unclassified Mycobacterium]OBB40226.1 D-beta-D-heptose 1-phosphate adenosyltransferase [Mycobacterium sp. 852002-51961_SCH5331710]OBG85476.1 D-beta-D-heptose 1-phosphate adenosyltransferase [Mycobacterium sp. E136]
MNRPLVIIGDSMLDLDVEGTATRLSPEAPVPVVDAERIWRRPGGAGLAAVLAARTGCDVVLVTAIGDDADGQALTDLLADAGVRLIALELTGSTVCKTRIRAAGQSMLRLDRGDGSAAGTPVPAEVSDILGTAAAVCVADYGRGVTAHTEIRELLARTAQRVPTVWDPHPRGSEPVPGCWLVTPNQDEAAGRSAESLRERWAARAVCITLGSKGALVATDSGNEHHPVRDSVARSGHGDTCGAGDRFAIAATIALAAGKDIQGAVADAVDAASRFVAAGGAVGVSSADSVGGIPSAATSTAITGDIAEVRDRLRRRGGRLVATGGCFDLLHTGHVRLLRQARDLGDALVVLLNSDASVRALKGPRRPVVADRDRARVLAALACVDAVVVFDERSPEAALEQLRPDVWVKGGDYTEADLPEAGVVRRHGGEVVLLPTVAGYSSSNLIAAARS